MFFLGIIRGELSWVADEETAPVFLARIDLLPRTNEERPCTHKRCTDQGKAWYVLSVSLCEDQRFCGNVWA